MPSKAVIDAEILGVSGQMEKGSSTDCGSQLTGFYY